MNRTLSLVAAALIPVAFAHAAELTPEQALARLNRQSPNYKACAINVGHKPYSLQTTVGNLYVFSNGERFVVLPDDDAAPAMLAYSESDSFDVKDNPGLAYWLEYYNNELDYIKKSARVASDTSVMKRSERPEIKPLIQTEWNQEAPYNELCPKVDGRETVTGCVATAMAQVMKYHNYPEHGKGTHSYLWRPGEEELSFNYDSIPFQWNLMTDRYDSKSTEEARHAVAELMLGCGISVDMHYEPGESGAATTLMGESLINIFDYSPSLWMPNRVFYGYYEWEDMIYSDLAEGLPVLYSGAGTAGGHQFICDGYSSDGFFHFNWGWGGLSNGYFLLTALNPDDLGVGGGAGGFNSSQIATLGVRPPKEGDKPVYIMYNTEAFDSGVKSVKAGDDFTGTGLYFNYSLSNLPADSRLGMKFESTDHSVVKFADGPSVAGFHPDDGRRDIQVKFPELPDGTYHITPVLHVDGKWSVVRMPVGYPAFITAVVADNEATITDQDAAEIEIQAIELPAVVYRDRDFPMPFTAVNKSTEEFYASVTPVLLDSAGTVVAKSQFRPLDVEGGKSERIADYIADFTAEKDQSFPAGNYTLVFRDAAGKDVSAPVDVKVEVLTAETKISVTDFRLDGSEPITAPEDAKFALTLHCDSGVFFGSLRVYIFPGDGGRDIAHGDSERVYLQGDEEKGLVIATDLSKLEDGEYIAGVYDGGESLTGNLRVRIERSIASIQTIETESGAPDEVYDLSGNRRQGELSPGLYIVRHGDSVRKLFVR